MEFKEIIQYVEENKKEHFENILKETEQKAHEKTKNEDEKN
ncbi:MULTISPECIES: hypothetical protein [Bacillus cereus group]|nr:hypothetical protein [Bacillus mobilis]MED0950993.1 hypothetical protein [Bacillus mobilis]